MGFFITFEGPEGCGKTTQVRRLSAWLRSQGYDVLTTREPGGTPIGDRVRDLLLDPAHLEMLPAAEFLLFSAARAQHVGQVIRPHLERNGIVLSDRFADSSLAYQGYGHGQDLATLRGVTRYATGGLTPDLTLCLDVPIEVGLARKAGGSGDAWNRMERLAIAFHQRVRAGFWAMAADEPGRWVVLDATQSIEDVHAGVRSVVDARLGRNGEGGIG